MPGVWGPFEQMVWISSITISGSSAVLVVVDCNSIDKIDVLQ